MDVGGRVARIEGSARAGAQKETVASRLGFRIVPAGVLELCVRLFRARPGPGAISLKKLLTMYN